MQEDFLHYLWKHKNIDVLNLSTVDGEKISIASTGEHNLDAGPDFFNAKLKIGDQLWAGNVEIHLKSSDWYLHNHEKDKAYDSVILHVVWQHDIDVYRKDNSKIPTLELKHNVSKDLLSNYNALFSRKSKWINCENDLSAVNDFTINNWLERLYFERLERKSEVINILLKKSNNNWEAVLFKMLSKSFGLKVNGEAFLSIANSFDFSVLRKTKSNINGLEALLFGQAGLLENKIEDTYYNTLKSEFLFLEQKFKLSKEGVLPIKFFRLRPTNFPTIRLSQLANLYHAKNNLFSKIIEAKSIYEIYKLFSVKASLFWDTHYTFEKISKSSKKKLTKAFIDLVIINTIIPLKFSYYNYLGKDYNQEIVKLISEIASEKNNIVSKFNKINQMSNTALGSQALIELKQNYCNKNKCLQCAIGNSLLSRKM